MFHSRRKAVSGNWQDFHLHACHTPLQHALRPPRHQLRLTAFSQPIVITNTIGGSSQELHAPSPPRGGCTLTFVLDRQEKLEAGKIPRPIKKYPPSSYLNESVISDSSKQQFVQNTDVQARLRKTPDLNPEQQRL